MRVRVAALALVLAVAGCTKWMYGFVLFPDPERPASVGVARVEVDRASIVDGDLDFRLMVGAIDGGVLLDRRLIPSWELEVTGVQDCDAGAPVRYFFWDYLRPPPTSSSMVEIRPGEWFGKDVQFPLSLGQEDGGGIPDCVDATFLLRLEVAQNPKITFRVKGSRERSGTDAGPSAPVPPPEHVKGSSELPETDAGQQHDAG